MIEHTLYKFKKLGVQLNSWWFICLVPHGAKQTNSHIINFLILK